MGINKLYNPVMVPNYVTITGSAVQQFEVTIPLSPQQIMGLFASPLLEDACCTKITASGYTVAGQR